MKGFVYNLSIKISLVLAADCLKVVVLAQLSRARAHELIMSMLMGLIRSMLVGLIMSMLMMVVRSMS